VVVRDFKPSKNAKITLLATNEVLKGKQVGSDFVISLQTY
jgi:hypothetical protein